jgi:hypothetical protein
VVSTAEQHRVVGGEGAAVGEGVAAVCDVAPDGRRIATGPDATAVTDEQGTPQPDGYGAHGRADLDRGAVGVQDEPYQLGVGDQAPQLAPGSDLTGVQQGAGDRTRLVLEGGELRRGQGDDDLRPHAVLGGCVADAQRCGAELLEGIRTTLVGRPVLVRGVRSPEGSKRDPDLLGGHSVERAGESQAAVRRIGGAEAAPEVLAPFVTGQRRGLLSTQDVPGAASERHRIETAGQVQELRLDRVATVRGNVDQDACDGLCLGVVQLTVSQGGAGARVIGCGPAGVQDPLGLAGAEPLLLAEPLPVVGEDPTDRLVRTAADLGALGGRPGAGAHPFELSDQPRQVREQVLQPGSVELVHLDARERTYGRGGGVEPLRWSVGRGRTGAVPPCSPFVRRCHPAS